MSLDFRHSVEIERPAVEVFDYLSDFENNPKWQGGMKSCQWTSPQKRELGSTYMQLATFMGKRIETHFVVSDYTPGQSISIESTQSTFPIQVTRSVEALDDTRCRVTAHIRGQPTGMLKFLSGFVRKNVAKDYDALKRLLESR